MPHYATHQITPTCFLIRWQITEPEPDLRARLVLTTDEEADLATIRHGAQRQQWLACRVALAQLLAGHRHPYRGLWKDANGKPHLHHVPGHVSLAHTAGWATAVWHQTRPVGLDVEPIRAQHIRVVPRVLSASEQADAGGQPARLAVYWCAKEALYKLYGKGQLTFREHLHIDPFPTGATYLTGHVRLPHHQQTLALHCLYVEPGLVMVAY